METPLTQLRSAVQDASGAVGGSDGASRIRPTLERPKKASFGDYSTNAAMLLAPLAAATPRDVAAKLAVELGVRLGPALDRVEVAGPGFLNLFLSDAWCVSALHHVLAAGDTFGGGGADLIERVNVEFVSANPTGPMTAASTWCSALTHQASDRKMFKKPGPATSTRSSDGPSSVPSSSASLAATSRGGAPASGASSIAAFVA